MPNPNITFDFEEFSDASGSSIALSGVATQGFVFTGSANVIETDELISGSRTPSPGLINGQTTVTGENVLVASTDAISGEGFANYREDTTARIADAATFDQVLAAGTPPLTLEALGFGTSFDLESLSLNALDNDGVTITIITYRAVITEVPHATFVGASNFSADLVAVDTFTFVVDASTTATLLDFSDSAFDDPLAAHDSKFDDIYAVEIFADDGSVIVLDDIMMIA